MTGSALGSPYVCKECGECVDALAAACEECAAERPRGGWALDAFLGRTVLTRYRLEKRIGRGSSSEVFLATDVTLPHDAGKVVVKTLPGAMSEASRRRFVTEVRAIRRLHSPHVVRVYDAGIDAGVPCIVMEHLDGETLRSFASADPAAASAASAAIGTAVAKALGEAHAAGIVHRDLKPDNVFLCGADRFVKVLDFGAAAVLGPEATQSSIGTPRYMAPEQIEQRGVDARTDIYALGVVLFELAARTPLFGGSIAEVLHAQLTQAPDAARLATHGTEPAFAQLVLQMLSKSADARPTSMHAVELQLAALGAPAQLPSAYAQLPHVHDAPLRAQPQMQRRAQRRGLLIAGFVVAASAVSAGVWRVVQPSETPADPKRAQAAASTSPPSEVTAHVVPSAPALAAPATANAAQAAAAPSRVFELPAHPPQLPPKRASGPAPAPSELAASSAASSRPAPQPPTSAATTGRSGPLSREDFPRSSP